jgi:ferredoxin-fold anticodon binding domain-containing protein
MSMKSQLDRMKDLHTEERESTLATIGVLDSKLVETVRLLEEEQSRRLAVEELNKRLRDMVDKLRAEVNSNVGLKLQIINVLYRLNNSLPSPYVIKG